MQYVVSGGGGIRALVQTISVNDRFLLYLFAEQAENGYLRLVDISHISQTRCSFDDDVLTVQVQTIDYSMNAFPDRLQCEDCYCTHHPLTHLAGAHTPHGFRPREQWGHSPLRIIVSPKTLRNRHRVVCGLSSCAVLVGEKKKPLILSQSGWCSKMVSKLAGIYALEN